MMIQAEVRDRTGWLTLDREDAANALSSDLIAQASDVLQEWRHDTAVRSVIITGAGKKVFCAGADLKERSKMQESEVWQAVASIRSFIESVYEMPQPVIAAINGHAIGGGLELALACDLRISTDQAFFSLAETGLGIIPGAGGTQRLPRLIGEQKAKEMILTGRKLAADEAEESGLILKYVPVKHLYEEASMMAGLVNSRAPLAIRSAKTAVNQGIQTDLQTGLELERKQYEQTIGTEDRLEGLRAFKEKRPPEFTGR
ncbi:enoyl-CoA hydratase-related protein [Bacillus daqingensis]|uniref:Enoyl-CoA hydratase-related protein n=1 Tax=Bacillus daqingensis TaxID=872396 RepID=A0ABV9P339_9BACI